MIKKNAANANGQRHHQAIASAAIIDISGLILGEFVRRSADNLNIRIYANTVARAVRTTSSIKVLCDHQDVQSAWVLHRTLAERLFHLANFSYTKSQVEFEAWSFFVQARSLKKSRATNYSDIARIALPGDVKEPPVWKRPKLRK